jgi:hypothetical protein
MENKSWKKKKEKKKVFLVHLDLWLRFIHSEVPGFLGFSVIICNAIII